MPRGAAVVPTPEVHAVVPGDVLIVGVQRPVRRGVGDVKEERLFAAGRVADHLDRLVANRIGQVKAFG